MANTVYLKKEVIPFLREWASVKLGVSLIDQKVEVGIDRCGRKKLYRFDGVSLDGRVGISISTSISYKTGQARKYFMDATMLNRASFVSRVMVFLDDVSASNFQDEFDGLVDLHKIEVMVCPRESLPDGMMDEIAALYRDSAKEVGDKSGPGRRLRRG